MDQIDARMQQEEAKADALKTAQKKSEDFLELVHTIDEKVSILVNRNKHDFYNKNPWAKPPQEDKIKEYYDKAKNYVSKDGKFLGSLVLRDEIKEDSKETISKLKNAGVKKTVMLTGDKKEIGEYVANKIGIDEAKTKKFALDDKKSALDKMIDRIK